MSLARAVAISGLYLAVLIHPPSMKASADYPPTDEKTPSHALVVRHPSQSSGGHNLPGSCAPFDQHLLDEALDPNPFHTLSDELVIHIFSYLSDPTCLSGVAQCDRRFHRLISDGHTLRSLELLSPHTRLPQLLLGAPLYALHTLSATQTLAWMDLFTKTAHAPRALKNVHLSQALVAPVIPALAPALPMEDWAPLEPGIPWIPIPAIEADPAPLEYGQEQPAQTPLDPISDGVVLALNHILQGTPTHPSRLEKLDLYSNAPAFPKAPIMQALCQGLGSGSSLKHLLLGDNTLEDSHAQALFQALISNQTLTHLALHKNSLQLNQCPALAEFLSANTTLTHLALEENFISDTTLLAAGLLENRALTHLFLESNDIDDAGLLPLSQALKSNNTLVHLDLGRNKMGPEGLKGLATALRVNSSLLTLMLDHNRLPPSSIQNLGNVLQDPSHQNLTVLDLSHNHLGVEGAKVLAQMLKKNTSLTYLYVGYNNLESQGLKALSPALEINFSLTHLCLESNNIGKNGAHALGQALAKNQSLRHINLESNVIGKKGAQALAKALEVNQFLRYLNLNHCGIQDDSADTLFKALEVNHALIHLAMRQNRLRTLPLESLSKNTTLGFLGVQGNGFDQATREEIEAFQKPHPSLHIQLSPSVLLE